MKRYILIQINSFNLFILCNYINNFGCFIYTIYIQYLFSDYNVVLVLFYFAFSRIFWRKIIEFDNEISYEKKNGSVEKILKLKTEKFTMKKMKIGKWILISILQSKLEKN
jgi:hypothetical protein